ncbi:hypothetical protein CRM22_009174 [Opisthorchis felineus]|uniref:Uncharacterized protein n=1 Tax=Opisthorchis felineus TaxID=147828 RepID=A0A4S2LFY1_OPIFE|nr:hypothetical protein CRM22_009174 [Opisthorchis felineus]
MLPTSKPNCQCPLDISEAGVLSSKLLTHQSLVPYSSRLSKGDFIVRPSLSDDPIPSLKRGIILASLPPPNTRCSPAKAMALGISFLNRDIHLGPQLWEQEQTTALTLPGSCHIVSQGTLRLH